MRRLKTFVVALVLVFVLLQPVMAKQFDHLRGGEIVLSIGGGALNNLVPGFNEYGTELQMMRLIYEPAFDRNSKGEFHPLLGESWEMLDENKIIRIVLRDDIHWYDGTPITSEDFYFSWYWWNEMDDGPDFDDGKDGKIEEIVIIDERTFEFHLEKPAPSLFATVATQAPLPKHLFEDIDPLEFEGHPWRVNPPIEAANGPFVIEDHIPGERIVFKRNDRWHGRRSNGPNWPSQLSDWPETALLDRVIYLSIPDADITRLMFEKGEIDAFSPAAKDIEYFATEAEKGRWQSAEYTDRGYIGPMLNHRHFALSDLRVRKALMHAIDFDLLIDVIYEGKATRAILPLPADSWVYDEEVISKDLVIYDYDVAEARRLLAEAGYADGIDLTMKMAASTSTLWGETLQYMWKEAGINVELDLVEWGSLLEQVGDDADYEIAYFGFSTQAFPSVIGYTAETKEDIKTGWDPGYVNPELHELQRQINLTTDRDEQLKLYAQAYNIWTRDLPTLMLTHGNKYTFLNPKLGGYEAGEIDVEFGDHSPQWHIKK